MSQDNQQKIRHSISPLCVRVATGAYIPKHRIVGIFAVDINKVRHLIKRLRSTNMLIDVTGKLPMKSLVLLDTGQGILSPMLVSTLSKYFTKE